MNCYYDRALKARDPRFRRVLDRMGYGRKDMVAAEPEVDAADAVEPAPQEPAEATDDGSADETELKQLRSQYEEAFGKKPFNGWDAGKLREKLAEAGA